MNKPPLIQPPINVAAWALLDMREFDRRLEERRAQRERAPHVHIGMACYRVPSGTKRCNNDYQGRLANAFHLAQN